MTGLVCNLLEGGDILSFDYFHAQAEITSYVKKKPGECLSDGKLFSLCRRFEEKGNVVIIEDRVSGEKV